MSASFLFDLDGTLVDTVYQHVEAWRQALTADAIQVPLWQIHRHVGMTGDLMLTALARELDLRFTDGQLDRVKQQHEAIYQQLTTDIQLLPGAKELLASLTDRRVAWAIATSGERASVQGSLDRLGVPDGVPVITGDRIGAAKPEPDIFIAAAEALHMPVAEAFVVGDSIWDLLAAQRAGALGIGLLTGGYGADELRGASAHRIYADPSDLLRHLHELGIAE